MTGDGIDELRGDLISLLPEGPMYFPAGTDTDMPLEARIAELVREQALRLTKEEVPHAVTAEVVEIDDKLVHVRVYTETESQKQILIGKGGTMVREIGRAARPGIEQLLGHHDLSPAAGEGVARSGAATRRCSSGSGSSSGWRVSASRRALPAGSAGARPCTSTSPSTRAGAGRRR